MRVGVDPVKRVQALFVLRATRQPGSDRVLPTDVLAKRDWVPVGNTVFTVLYRIVPTFPADQRGNIRDQIDVDRY